MPPHSSTVVRRGAVGGISGEPVMPDPGCGQSAGQECYLNCTRPASSGQRQGCYAVLAAIVPPLVSARKPIVDYAGSAFTNGLVRMPPGQ